MKPFLSLFAIPCILSCMSTSASAYTGILPDWKTDAYHQLALPQYEGKFVEICVEDDCIRVDRMRGERDLWSPLEDYALAVKPVNPDTPTAKSTGSGHPSPALDSVLDKLSRMSSAKGKVKVKYYEKDVKPDGSSNEIKVEVEIEASTGAAARDPGDPQESDGGGSK